MSLKIHHLQISQSERIPWLCEELQIPYTLILHQRAPYFAPQSLKALNPLAQAPVIQDGDITLFELGACMEYIIHKYGGGRLALPPLHKGYAEYVYWFHFANGNLQQQVLSLLQMSRLQAPEAYTAGPLDRFRRTLEVMDTRLANNVWLAGDEFTAADIMITFTLTTMRAFYLFDLSEYKAILAYLERLVQRDGYKNARAKADPGLEVMVEGRPPKSFGERLREAGRI